MEAEHIGFLFASQRHTDVDCPVHIHASAEIVIVTAGTLEMTVGNKKYSIKRGQGLYITPFEMHSFCSPIHNKCHVLLFSKELAGYFHEFLQNKEMTSHIFSLSQESLSLSERTLPDETNTADYFTAQAVLSLLCLDIVSSGQFIKKERCPDDVIAGALEYINHHFADDLSLQTVAHQIGIRPVALSKSFSKRFGKNFQSYVHFLRCNCAADMIKASNLTMAEIASCCGFGSIRSFNRNFKELYGIAPSEYKKAYRFI